MFDPQFTTIQKNILKEFLRNEGFTFDKDLGSARLHYHGFGTMEYQLGLNREGKVSFCATNSLPNGSYKCWNKLLRTLKSFCPGGRFSEEDWNLLSQKAKTILKALPESPTTLSGASQKEDLTYLAWATDREKRMFGWRVEWQLLFNKQGEIEVHEERIESSLKIPCGF